MALALTVTLDEHRAAAIIDATGIDATAGNTYSITRQSPSGNTAGVRGFTTEPAATPEVIARDYEAPLNLDLVYTVTVWNQAGNTVATASAPPFRIDWFACESWLVDLARPTNSLAVTIESLVQLTFDSAAGVHRVLDRRAPVLTTLPAWTPAGELIVLTDTLTERDQVKALLGNGYPILLRTSPDLGIGNLYLGVTAFIEERFLTLGTRPERRFRAQVLQVERPSPIIYVPLAPNTYANVAATFATYADLKAGVGTYNELAYTYPAGAASPIAPWPPDDV